MNPPPSEFDKLRQQRRELLSDLTKQSEARKIQVRQLLQQCASQRDKRDPSSKPSAVPSAFPSTPPVVNGPNTVVPPQGQFGSAPPAVESVPQMATLAIEPAYLDRLNQIEDALASLTADANRSPVDNAFAVERAAALEEKMNASRKAFEEIINRLRVLNGDLAQVSEHLNKLDATVNAIQSRTASWDTGLAAGEEDFRRLAGAFEASGGEVRRIQERIDSAERSRQSHETAVNSELTNLATRFSKVESGLLWTIDMVQSSEQGTSRMNDLRERIRHLEEGFDRFLQSLESVPRPAQASEVEPPRPLTASVLANLSKLVNGLRDTQAEKAPGSERNLQGVSRRD